MNANTLPNTRCIKLACERLGITCVTHDQNENFLSVHLNKPLFFVNFATPFNDEGISKICRDKEFSYTLLKENIRAPKTLAFFDPHHQNKDYIKYIVEEGHHAIVKKITSTFSLPVIVKMNSGSKGINVFLCHLESEILHALQEIYRKDSPNYDYIAIAQEYIRIEKEYRVIVFEREIVLIYEKELSNAKFTGNLSPLHQKNSRAVLIDTIDFYRQINAFILPLYKCLDVQFTGLDILLDQNNELVLLELNTRPGFAYFTRDNGEKPLIDMYEKILKKVKENAPCPPISA